MFKINAHFCSDSGFIIVIACVALNFLIYSLFRPTNVHVDELIVKTMSTYEQAAFGSKTDRCVRAI